MEVPLVLPVRDEGENDRSVRATRGEHAGWPGFSAGAVIGPFTRLMRAQTMEIWAAQGDLACVGGDLRGIWFEASTEQGQRPAEFLASL